MADRGRRVGTLRVPEARIFRRNSEFAAWWTDIRVTPGTYPLLWTNQGYGWVSAALPGVVVDESNASHFGGVAMGVSHRRNIGKPETYHWGIRDYELARTMLEGSDPNIKLDPGVKAERVEGTGSDGKSYHTWKLSFPPEA